MQILVLEKKTGITGTIWILAAILNLGLNVIFVPRIGILGAAVTTQVAFSLAFVLSMYYSFKCLVYDVNASFILKCLVPSAIMGMVVVIGGSQISGGLLGIILLVGVSALVYGVSLFILKGFKKEENRFSGVCSGPDPMYVVVEPLGPTTRYIHSYALSSKSIIDTFFHIQRDTLFMVGSIVAIIPARGGSKGIPRKNINTLGGKPLIAYTIEEALKSKYLDHTFVSTEDPEIAKVSKKCGAQVIDRPSDLAKDTSKTVDAILHAVEYLEREDIHSDVIVLLQPTSPLRITEDIDMAVKSYLDNECDSVIGVCEPDHSPFWCFTLSGKYLQPLFDRKYDNTRRQDLPEVVMPNGAIYVSSPESIRKYDGFYGDRTIAYCMPPERSIDIDTPLDFTIAEVLICERR